MGVFDVPATLLIEEVAKDLEKELQKPEFVDFVKTGASRERAPLRRDWWFVRSASILYRIYKEGPLGTESLRTYYGGRKNRGTRPHKFFKASGKVIRTCLQELEKKGYIKKAKKGRVITGKGQSFLIKKSKIIEDLLKKRKEKKIEKAEKKETEEEKRVREELKKQEMEAKEKEKKAEVKKKEKKDVLKEEK